MQNNGPLPGFLAIARELRNSIYDLAFTDDVQPPINLLTARPPSSAIVFVCTQTAAEAQQMFRSYSDSYWQRAQLYLEAEVGETITITNLCMRALANVRQLDLRVTLDKTLAPVAGSSLSVLHAVELKILRITFRGLADGRWWVVTDQYPKDKDRGFEQIFDDLARVRLRNDGAWGRSGLFPAMSLQELCAVVGITLRLQAVE
ncbi:hypothetical protein LTR56_025125 [Elasticomyces elasticus]|nr:hypothetical protein LTR56_025125 [Elasticomyces elasticus]KAK3621317.1 hypothetical protein LTR22_025252 [Elasticomyces elasticus]KAK4904856.1 hypothetical protein LTR49_025747 [Elasticomyces elasticus]KAK5741010.1 hypothetical protein LTS12_024730 [Elasticomyces elasticus]